MKISAAATVILTVEIPASGGYGEGWKLEDLHKQVIQEVTAAVKNKFSGVRIIGEPKVRVCTIEAEL